MKYYSTLLLVLFTITAFCQKNNDPFSSIERTPEGYIRCLSMEADALSRNLNPYRGSLEEFEQQLAPLIEEYKRLRSNDPNRFPAVYTIPVVVHVIHNGDPIGSGENISDAQVLSQIRVLNEDFRKILGTPGYNNNSVGADVEIEFCMAQTDPFGQPTNGINRVQRTEASWGSMAAIDGTLKPATIWPPTEYLNMWSVRFGGGLAGVLGYAQFPDASGLAGMPGSGGAANSDGVVASFDAFGSQAYAAGNYNPTYNLGRTMTHEVGHWLGLRHIWGDGGCTVDDFCGDTPTSDAANFGCPNGHVSCSTTDMIENYMDYTDDACMNIFTLDQKTRARTVMTVSPRRRELALSTKCQPPAPFISFSTDETTVDEGTDCGFQDITLTLSIARVPSADALVTFTSIGTATGAGIDYSISPASVVFPAGSNADRNVTIRIYNDGEVENTEDLTIAFNVSTSGDALATTGDLRDHTIFINDDDFAPSLLTETDILSQDFENGLAPFTTTGQAGSDRFLVNNSTAASSNFWVIENTNNTQFAYTNDDRCNCNKNRDRLISPSFSLVGYTNATLSFDHAFSGVNGETALVQISSNGGPFNTISTLTNNSTDIGNGIMRTPWVFNNTINLNAYLGQNNLVIRFQYSDGNGWQYGLAVDNFRIFTSIPSDVQTNINSNNKDEHQVRANETTHWFDPASGRVMATIENTSSWNYNCTTMEVDRDQQITAGAAAVPFNIADPASFLMAKTFYINPADNNPSGTYNVTFYFTEAEISGWEAVTGKSRTNLKIIKVANNPISTVNAGNYNSFNVEIVPATIGNFGPHTTLSASFSSGFSGFGFGDPNPTLLPIELLDFYGTREAQEVRLKWATASENGSDKFIVERSADGISFDYLGEIKANGESEIKVEYSILDRRPINGINYYRLVQYSKNGSSQNSKVVSIDMSEQLPETLTIFPNPASDYLNFRFKTPYTDDYNLEIIDQIGRKILIINDVSSQKFSSGNYNISALSKGVYILRLTQGPRVYTKLFVKE